MFVFTVTPPVEAAPGDVDAPLIGVTGVWRGKVPDCAADVCREEGLLVTRTDSDGCPAE